MDLEKIALSVAEARIRREYRPVVVGIIIDLSGRMLFVNSAKNENDWGMLQGGIEDNEDARTALFREIEEELDVSLSECATLSYLGWEDMDAEPGRSDKRGWSKGKRYFFFSLILQKDSQFEPHPSEIARIVWAESENAATVMQTTRQEKRELLLRFIARAVGK